MLLAVARAVIRATAFGAPPPALPPDLPPGLRAPGGAFVTVQCRDDLRGCIGSITPEGSLAELVARMAAAAASRDPRFPPLAPEDLSDASVEVSVLSPTRTVSADEIDPRTHGVSIRLGSRRAVLLPQVAARYGWDRETLLARLCEKAELAPTAWQHPGAVLLAFTVETVEGPV